MTESKASITQEITPSPWVALGMLLIAAFAGLLYGPLALILGLFGIFLAIQTYLLRLRFEADAMLVLRAKGTVEIKRFPYKDWQYWQIFWPPFPVLFYFREVNSIHFLPMLFNADQLTEQLTQRLGPSGKIETAALAEEASPPHSN